MHNELNAELTIARTSAGSGQVPVPASFQNQVRPEPNATMPLDHSPNGCSMRLLTNPVRTCFRMRRLPFWAKLYEFVFHRSRRSHAGQIFGFALRRVYAALRTVQIRPTWGTVEYLSPNGWIPLRFDARNTQFHSIFLPKFAEGYEPETSILLDAFLNSSDVLWDVGSNWGHFSLYACSRPEYKGQVHAFEPMVSSFGDLSSMVEQAGLRNRVHCHQVALGGSNGSSCMTVPDGVHSGLASLDAGGTGPTVKVVTAESMNLPDPAVIKLDVEGHEAAVLRGAAGILSRARPVVILENVSDDTVESLEPLRLLESLGYRIFQPSWAFECNSTKCLTHAHRALSGHQRLGLALVPMPSEERNLRRRYLNLLALPPELAGNHLKKSSLPPDQAID